MISSRKRRCPPNVTACGVEDDSWEEDGMDDKHALSLFLSGVDEDSFGPPL